MPCERKQLKILWGLANEMRVPAAEHSSLACAIVDEMFVELRKALAACDESPWRSIDLFYSAEDREYVARLSHAHGISALGATPAHALRELSIVAGMIPDEFLPAAPEGVKP